jgi:hypothetical protein
VGSTIPLLWMGEAEARWQFYTHGGAMEQSDFSDGLDEMTARSDYASFEIMSFSSMGRNALR